MFLRNLFARVTGAGAGAPSARVGVAIVMAAFAVGGLAAAAAQWIRAGRARTAHQLGAMGAAALSS